jgi:Family of unknown function (DUF5317)
VWLTLLAVAVGVAAGLVSGGTLRGLGRVRPAAPLLIVAWAGLLVATLRFDVPAAGTLFLLAHLAGIGFAFLNRYELPGIAVLGVGIALNLAVIVVNDAMPYRVSSLAAAGIDIGTDIGADGMFPVNAQTRPERDTDRLLVLADVIPFDAGPIHEVLSAGDVVAALGAAYTAYRAMTARSRPRGSTARPSARPPRVAVVGAGPAKTPPSFDRVRIRQAQTFETHELDMIAPTEGEARLLIDLTADRAMHPERYTSGRSATDANGNGIDSLANDFDRLIDISDGALPGDTFWEARKQQMDHRR